MDFTGRYNTRLSPEEEIRFRQEFADKLGDLYDYDVRGAWKALADGRIQFDERGHLTDQFKKPNHPTFSDQSMYHGVDGHIGGVWHEGADGYSYIAPLNHLFGREDLRHYFDKYEPDVKLIDLRDVFYR